VLRAIWQKFNNTPFTPFLEKKKCRSYNRKGRVSNPVALGRVKFLIVDTTFSTQGGIPCGLLYFEQK